MRHICIIGNSAAGVSCAKTIRQTDSESKITIISQENYPAYLRFKLLDFLYQGIKESDLFEFAKDFYKENNIELVNNVVTHIEPEKKRLYFKEKGFLEFDILVLACGRKPKFPDIKGTNKRGVVTVYNFDDAKQIIETLPLIQTVCITGSNYVTEKLVDFFAQKNIEVKLFCPQLKINSESKSIEYITDSQIQEILGNGDAKAVKLSNNKIIGTNLVVYADILVPNIDLVKDTPIKYNNGIIVNSSMLTNIENIYAAGDVTEITGREKSFSWANAEQEGTTTGRCICQI
ncbi:MAG: FAD-dependent oxidoreductase [Candidatus Omnitrophica bacterium]|nr:FAD-dependent oxidoreductase [Candidatus Omnitrophota bacterium]MDD5351889.1 FAD-dependent oxidoreductase [Candidatus Omnitrophota bacterium]MDD5550715.1 FAD-dependent oxidoreductase [Candidatus Omnitrophota bacterium]